MKNSLNLCILESGKIQSHQKHPAREPLSAPPASRLYGVWQAFSTRSPKIPAPQVELFVKIASVSILLPVYSSTVLQIAKHNEFFHLHCKSTLHWSRFAVCGGNFQEMCSYFTNTTPNDSQFRATHPHGCPLECLSAYGWRTGGVRDRTGILFQCCRSSWI